MKPKPPTSRARPAGVLGAEVWVKLVDADSPAPTDPAALTFLTMTTKPSFRAEFKAGEGGKTAVYMARWVCTRGNRGPCRPWHAPLRSGRAC